MVNASTKQSDIYGYIYTITNKINGKKYIGQATLGFDKRYGSNLVNNTSNVHLRRAIEKHGIDNFQIEKEFCLAYDKEELDSLEIFWLNFFGGAESDATYNFRDGGSFGAHNSESRKRISLGKIGKKHTNETLKKMRIAKLKYYSSLTQVEKNNIYDKSRSGVVVLPRTKFLISTAKIGHAVSSEAREKISQTLKGRRRSRESIEKQVAAQNKPVICLNTNVIYKSIKEASLAAKVDCSGISKCCKNTAQSAGRDHNGVKLIWEYYPNKEVSKCY